MADTSVISKEARVTGKVVGSGDLEILGHVEGEVDIAGDVTIDASGTVGASVSARKLTVRGAVRGDLIGHDLVELDAGAKVLGDIRAPRVVISPGALVKGFVSTGGGKADGGASNGEGRARAAAKPAATSKPTFEARKPEARPEPRQPEPRQERQEARPAPRPHHAPAPIAHKAPPPRPSQPSHKKAPPPVVPVLKKGAKATQKKR